MAAVAFKKVTAFVLESERIPSRILTIAHPMGGRQVPSGSVEDGEGVEAAVVREFREETGLRMIERLVPLDIELAHLSGSGIMRSTCTPTSEIGNELICKTEPFIRRGYSVVINEEQGDWVHVSHHTYDFNVNPAAVIETIAGWVPQSVVARAVERHFYVLFVPKDHRRSWHWDADGHTFLIEWVAFEQSDTLVGVQQRWLSERYVKIAEIANAAFDL